MKDYLSFDASSLVCSSSQMRAELRKSGFQSDFSSYLTRVESSSGLWCVFKNPFIAHEKQNSILQSFFVRGFNPLSLLLTSNPKHPWIP